MRDLVVLVPTRGRPEAAAELVRAFNTTCTASTELVFVVDGDDPALAEYAKAVAGLTVRMPVSVRATPSHTMVEALNMAATTEVGEHTFAVGFLGDDHRPRTAGWDTAYLEALRELGTGIVYGNDLLQRKALPTQCAMTTDIVRALGYMAPPPLRHLYVDNFWRDLGRAAGCLRYLPDVVVEHMHPLAGKAAVDEGYERVNAAGVYQADDDAYRRFSFDGGMLKAIEAVAQIRHGVTDLGRADS